MEGLMEYLKVRFEQRAIAWQNEIGEKKHFSDLYFNIITALQTLIGNDNLYIKVAVHRLVAEDEMKLNNILKKYT